VAKYDVAIIGSGPGGYVAAIRAGELGLKTVVVEKDPFLGGTCLHVGCIPTKVLLHHADVYDHFKNGAELGFEVSGLKVNWANIISRKEKIVKKHAKGIEFLFKKNKVEWKQGWGRYEGPGKISVEKDGKKETIEANNILMVSGSEARALPGIEPDHKQILTNRSILELPAIPKSLIVVGAGAVGVEFASIYNSFGTEVTILEALPRLVPVEDEEISVELDKSFKKKNIAIQTGCKVESVKKDAKGVTVTFADKDGKKQTKCRNDRKYPCRHSADGQQLHHADIHPTALQVDGNQPHAQKEDHKPAEVDTNGDTIDASDCDAAFVESEDAHEEMWSLRFEGACVGVK